MGRQCFFIGDRAYWYEWSIFGMVGGYAVDGNEKAIYVCNKNVHAPMLNQYAIVTVNEDNGVGDIEATYEDSESAWEHAEKLFRVRTAENSTMGNDNLRERNELVAFLRQQMDNADGNQAECSMSNKEAWAWANGKESAFADVLRWLGESVD